MSEFEADLHRRLDDIRAHGLYRELRTLQCGQSTRVNISGKELLNFSSNDYLGLAAHPKLREAGIEALRQYGAGSGASRLISGSLPPHRELEEVLAAFKGLPAALAFSSGYSTAVGAICALIGRGDVIVLDKLVHASIVDAARLSGATIRVFGHNDLDQLEKILRWCDRAAPTSATNLSRKRILVVTESVFSMDGDLAPLREIASLKDHFGAWLMIDEAHATGLYGTDGRGLADHSSMADRVEIHMGTLGKALGSAGGYICGLRPLIQLLVNKARSFVFSTAPVPASAAAARAGIDLVASEQGASLRAKLWRNVESLIASNQAGPRPAPEQRSAIIPVHVGPELQAMEAAARLFDRGIFVPAIRFPTVRKGQARLRITITAAHTAEEIAELKGALESEGLNPAGAQRF